MAPKPPLKAILFDIGGVVVASPFQAILDYEKENNIPIGYINFAIQKGPPDTGAWQLLERGETPLNDAWFLSFKQQLSQPAVWSEFCTKQAAPPQNPASTSPSPSSSSPPPPIDAKALFWRMMRVSRRPDPWMYPALKKLRASTPLLLGALSNTVLFPPGILDDAGTPFDHALTHDPPPSPHAHDPTDIRALFDVFVSSAHAGVRKPERRAYEVAVGELDRVARERGMPGGGVRAEEVLFLDDIGGNLRAARACGLRTLKVGLGGTREAVGVLEGEVGVDLGSGLGMGRERGKAGSRL